MQLARGQLALKGSMYCYIDQFEQQIALFNNALLIELGYLTKYASY